MLRALNISVSICCSWCGFSEQGGWFMAELRCDINLDTRDQMRPCHLSTPTNTVQNDTGFPSTSCRKILPVLTQSSWSHHYTVSQQSSLINQQSIDRSIDQAINQAIFPFSDLTLLVVQQEGHSVCKKPGVGLSVVTIRLDICKSYNSICHHHLFLISDKIQNGDILVSAKPGPPGKW